MAETYGTCVIYYPPTTDHPPTWSSHSLPIGACSRRPLTAKRQRRPSLSGTPRGCPAEAPAAKDPKPLNGRFGK
jgi:hypothetical protein